MKECIRTDKPQIAILMAVYEPDLQWFREQLCSINEQTYENISLYLCDDCSEKVAFSKIKQCVYECITKMSVEIVRNAENVGSNATFARLTELAQGDYFAYADQDDIWESDKLSALLEMIEQDGAVMAYSDMSVIDARSEKIAESLTEIRPRLEYMSGYCLLERYFFRNCTAGCSMLVRSMIAKAALPFPEATVCDHWLSIIAANAGKIAYVNRPLVRYRQHGQNQTGILHGVNNKKTYREKRLIPLIERMEYLKQYCKIPAKMQAFADARLNGNILGIWKERKYSPFEAKFEIVMLILPSFIVSKLLNKIKNRSNR